jgi:hypothetical protein
MFRASGFLWIYSSKSAAILLVAETVGHYNNSQTLPPALNRIPAKSRKPLA